MPSQRLQVECLNCGRISPRQVFRKDMVIVGSVIRERCSMCRQIREHHVRQVLEFSYFRQPQKQMTKTDDGFFRYLKATSTFFKGYEKWFKKPTV